MTRREPDETGEQERMQNRALSLANSIASDLQRTLSAKRSQIVLARCEELTKAARELSAALR